MSETDTDTICFKRQDFNVYFVLLLSVFAFAFYVVYVTIQTQNQEHEHSESDNVKEELFIKEKEQQQYERRIAALSQLNETSRDNILLSRLINPLAPPYRLYPGGRLDLMGPLRSTGRGLVIGSRDFQMVGFLSSGRERYQLFGRYKYPGRSEKWEYYISDDNGIKIPLKTKNENEITDGDTISIPTIGNDLKASIYEYDNFRYDPRV